MCKVLPRVTWLFNSLFKIIILTYLGEDKLWYNDKVLLCDNTRVRVAGSSHQNNLTIFRYLEIKLYTRTIPGCRIDGSLVHRICPFILTYFEANVS